MFQPLIDECKLRNFSDKTIKAYLHYNDKFLKFCKKKPQQVTREDIRNYLLYLENKNCSSSMINLAHNSINFYYKEIMQRRFKPIKFQKREQKDRGILSLEEIKKLIDITENKKHKLIISMLYASGVRVSELIKIKIEDIKWEKKLLLVRQGKGKKDRHTILSERVITEIKEYLTSRKEKGNYLFPSYKTHITTRTVQEILKQAGNKTNLNVTPHKLRHSFATHLVDSGVHENKIQKLLGHASIKTTQIYIKLSTKSIENIKSPHDNI